MTEGKGDHGQILRAVNSLMRIPFVAYCRGLAQYSLQGHST